ncbi:hypothetical protein V2J09_013305 [Rumex salicifolius]
MAQASARSFQFHINSPQSILYTHSSSPNCIVQCHFPRCRQIIPFGLSYSSPRLRSLKFSPPANFSCARCSNQPIGKSLRTCKICKTQFDPCVNHPRACLFHTAHFGGETKRKFESVYTGGTMNTPNSGQVVEYWHCCGSEDPFHPGCAASPHSSYDD